jgi:hypothetical protein
MMRSGSPDPLLHPAPRQFRPVRERVKTRSTRSVHWPPGMSHRYHDPAAPRLNR